MYAIITEQDIIDFGTTFKGGAEERADILRYYEAFEGNMTKVFDWVMLSDPEQDSHRFMDLINSAIETGEAKRYKKYTTWAAKVAKKQRPAAVVPIAAPKGTKGRKKGGNTNKGEINSEQALVAMMQQRRQGVFEGMLSSLSAKYGVDDVGVPPEPTDEEFEAARKRMEAKKKAAGSSGSSGERKKRQSGGGDNKQQKKKQK
jgi:DnaJ homolog subfamily C member 9